MRKPAAKKSPPRKTLDELGVDWLCEEIIGGRSFRDIAKQLDMNVSTLTRWAAKPEHEARVRAARVASAQAFDEMALEGILNAKSKIALGRAKEAAHHLRWRASNVNPGDYGDKLRVDSNVSFTNLSEAELARRAAEIEERLRGEAQAVDGDGA